MVKTDSPAVKVAKAHIEAWASHEYEKARSLLSSDVHVVTTTTQPFPPRTDLTGVDQYMDGLRKFADTVQSGSARFLSAVGDRHNALIAASVQGNFGAGPVMLPMARLYRIDDDNKIKSEQVIFYAAESE